MKCMYQNDGCYDCPDKFDCEKEVGIYEAS